MSRTRPPAKGYGAKTQVRPPLDLDEARHVIELIRGHDLEPIVLRGEVLGLRWCDVNLQTGVLQIRQTLKEGSTYLPDGTGLTRPRFAEPKTRNSARDIQVPTVVADALKAQRSRQAGWRLRAGDAWQDNDLVFTNELGGALWPSNVLKKWTRFLASNGLRHVRFHDLRHTTATLMLAAEVPLESVSQTLGHASIVITKDTYAGYVPELINRGTAALATAILGADETRPIAVGEPGLDPRPDRTNRAPHWTDDR